MRSKVNTHPLMRAAGALALLGSLVGGTTALAQGSSVIIGKVTDASSNNPVANVVVTATSPQMQGEQIVVTDKSGSYRVPQLPPGTFTLRFESEQYHPLSRAGIEIRPGQTIRINVKLLPEAIQGTDVVVVGRAPTIDVGSSSTGANVGTDFVKNIAVSTPGGVGGSARSFESLAAVAPQAQGDAYGVSINGTTSPENSYTIDGLSVSDTAFGINGSSMSQEFVEDVDVITGGYLPEFGRTTGGVIAATTKSGGNEFHGSAWAFLVPGALSGQGTKVISGTGTINVLSKNYFTGDFGADVGGYIIKNKLWFFAGVQPSFSRYKSIRTLAVSTLDTDGDQVYDKNGLAVGTTYRDTEKDYFSDSRQVQFFGKLTYLLNSNNRLSAQLWVDPYKNYGTVGLFALPQNYTDVTGTTMDAEIKWSSSFFQKRLLLDATLGWHHNNGSVNLLDGSTIGGTTGYAGIPEVVWRRDVRHGGAYHSILDFDDPGITADYAAACNEDGVQGTAACGLQTYVTGGPGYINMESQNRWQGKLVLTGLVHALGHHVFKAGVDGELTSFNQTKAYSGGVVYRESTDGTEFEDYREYGVLTAPDTAQIALTQVSQANTNILGAFVQDSWNVADLFTVNVGVRYDVENLVGTDGKSGFSLPNQWSPRIGLIWDPTQEGRAKIYANYARYYEDVSLDAIDREFPGERQVVATRNADPTAGAACDPVNDPKGCRDPATLLAQDNTGPNVYWGVTGGDASPVDPNLTAQSTDEIVAGAQYEVFSNARVGVQYTRRYLNKVIEDMSVDNAATYFLGNPGYGIATSFPKAVRNYNAFTFSFEKVWADLWLARASYTYSNLVGNYPGLFRPATGQLDPNINSTFDLVSLLGNQTGPLPGDVRHKIKVFAAKEFPIGNSFSISLGLTYRGFSGAPLNYLGSQVLYGPGESYILPRGSAGRLPWIHTFDGKLGINFRLGHDSVATLTVESFNLFNSQQIAGEDENYTFNDANPIINGTKADLANLKNADDGSSVEPNPNFLKPTAYQTPRSVRLGLRVTF